MKMLWRKRWTGKPGAALIRVAGLVFGLTVLYACDS